MKNDSLTNHPLQSPEWGEFRKKTGVKVLRINRLQITVHKIPHTSWTIGYAPKGPLPTADMISQLKKIGKQENCIFIQLEPNVPIIENFPSSVGRQLKIKNLGLRPAAHPLITKYTFILDLTKSEEELLRAMHPKTRYNIKIAVKHGVQIVEDDSGKAFETYLKLTDETTKRQGFYAHTQSYHKLMWKILRQSQEKLDKDKLTAHLFLAKYKNEILAAWILFVYRETLYYPYGASSSLNRETMASNLMMWEVIKFGKKLGLKKFDMWGALGPNPDKNDSWLGFHRFKQGYGGRLMEFVGSFDLVINPILYFIYMALDKIRWVILKIRK